MPPTTSAPAPPDPDDGRKKKARFTKNPTSRYKPSGGMWYGYPSAAIDNSPYFTWYDIPRMLRDPQVRFVERMWRAPYRMVKHAAKSDDPRVKRFVEDAARRFWSRSLPRLLSRYFRYGFAPGGAEFRYDRRTKLVHLDRVQAVDPPDAQPREFARGRREGQFAGFTLSGVGGGAVAAPHAFWFAGHGEFGRYYDFPVLAGMFEPWLEKRGRNGAVQSRRTWFRTASFRGAVLRYPEGRGDVTDENPEGRDNQDIANETLDALEAGSRLAINSETHPDGSGKYKWDVEWAQGQPDVAGLREYPQDLDREMLIGAGIPPEVLEASEVGSGWSGRMIPLLAFFGSVDELAGTITEEFDRLVLRHLVRLNFGGAWYELEPLSLAEEIKKQATAGPGGSEGKNPLAGLFGGAGGGKEEPEEKAPLALSDARAALDAKGLPQDPVAAAVERLADRVRELSAAFDESEVNRDHGKFAEKPGGVRAPAPDHPDRAAHVADAVAGLRADVPELADPSVWAKAGDRVTTAAAKVYMRMLRATPAALRVIELAKDVLDTPDDVRKWGGMYNAEAGAAGPKVHDAVKDATGISTHLAISIGSKLLARALLYAKKKLAGGAELSATPADPYAEAGEVLAGILSDLADSLGLPVGATAEAVTAALRAAAAKQLSDRPVLDAASLDPAHDPQGAADKIGRYTKREIVSAIVVAMATAQLRATARGKPDAAADHLDALADLSQDGGRLESVLGGKELSWVPYEGARGGRGWKNTETGRVVYGGDRPGEKREKRRASAEEAHTALAAIEKDGGTKEHVDALAANMAALTVPQLRAVRRRFGANAGGKRRHAELVARLLDHVRGVVAAGREPKAAEPGNPAPPDQFTPEQASALRDYTDPGKPVYAKLNAVLRGRSDYAHDFARHDLTAEDRAEAGRLHRTLRAAFRDHATTPDHPLYRGLSLTGDEAAKVLADARASLESGTPYTQPGYMSTSADRDTADSFAMEPQDPEKDTGVVFEIRASSALPLESVAAEQEAGSEREFLLPHNSRLRVVGVTPAKNKYNPAVVEVEQLPPTYADVIGPAPDAGRAEAPAAGLTARDLSWVPDFSAGVFAWRNAETGELVSAADDPDDTPGA